MMLLYLTQASNPEDVLSLADAKQFLRVDYPEDDIQIRSLIAAAVQNIDGRDGWLGRAVASQSWELRIPEFRDEIAIPLPPLVDVQTVKFYDADNQLQTLPSSIYEVAGIGSSAKARILLKSGQRWPQTFCRAEAVLINFSAGYTTVPAPIVMAVRHQVATMYENRQSIVFGDSVRKLPGGVEAMLMPYRIWA